MSSRHTFEQATAKLENRVDRLAIIFQWIKDDLISFSVFGQLIEWLEAKSDEAREQDSFD